MCWNERFGAIAQRMCASRKREANDDRRENTAKGELNKLAFYHPQPTRERERASESDKEGKKNLIFIPNREEKCASVKLFLSPPDKF